MAKKEKNHDKKKSKRRSQRGKKTNPQEKRAEIMQKQGHKDDGEKIRYELIPAGPLHQLASVYSIGGVKYDSENWRKGISYKRLFGALMRHAWAWMRGENIDGETGCHHMASVAWCAFAIIELQMQHKKRKDLDDRYLPPDPMDTSMFETAIKLMKAKKASQ